MSSYFLAVGVLLLSFLYLLYGAIYRLFFSPIAKFPGPPIAALTFWYEFYYDVVLQGCYTWRILELHKKYGSIVRINPQELHVLDPTFYNTLYVGSSVRPTNKWYWSARMFGTSSAAVGTADHSLHRHRRSALNPFFSNIHLTQLEPRVQYHVNRLVERLCNLKKSGMPVNLVDAFTALTADIIGDLAFGRGYGFLEEQNFKPEWHKFMMELSRNTHVMKQFPWLYKLLTLFPRALVSFIHPLTRQLFTLQDSIAHRVRVAQARQITDNTKARGPHENQCMLDTLLSSPHLTPADKTPHRLGEESLTLLGAGTVTTAWTLSVTCYHLLADPSSQSILRAELSDIPTAQTWHDYEKLPYLSAVISEGLRLSHGTSHRLARISPHVDLRCGDRIIPAGTPVSMTQMHTHLNPSIFPSPDTFMPTRWLPSHSTTEEIRERKKNLVPFSKGSRMCVGMNLAYAELYLTIGALFGAGTEGEDIGFGLELFETGERDVRVERDWFNPVPTEGSKGVRVLVR